MNVNKPSPHSVLASVTVLVPVVRVAAFPGDGSASVDTNVVSSHSSVTILTGAHGATSVGRVLNLKHVPSGVTCLVV